MKILHGSIAAALTFSTAAIPLAPALAQATPQRGANAELIEFCRALIASGEFADTLNLGQCMSFNLTPEQGFSTQFCHYLRGEDLLDDAGFEDYDDCVRNLPF